LGFFDRITPKPIYSSTKLKPGSILTTESSHVLQGKQALLQFCEYFRNVPLDQLQKDPLFILYMKQLTEKKFFYIYSCISISP